MEESLLKKDLKNIYKLIGTSKVVKDLSWYRKVYLPKIIANYDRYHKVSKITNVPVGFIACVHAKENSQDLGKFEAYLGNGEKIIGTGRRSKLVPKNRGPFQTWEAGAIDALMYDKMHGKFDWSLEEAIYQWEKYNGFGYAKRGKLSPYVWAFTNHGENTGYYIRDGVYSSTAKSKNIGAYALYTMLIKEDPRFVIGVGLENAEVYSKSIIEENQKGVKPERTEKLKSSFLKIFGKKSKLEKINDKICEGFDKENCKAYEQT